MTDQFQDEESKKAISKWWISSITNVENEVNITLHTKEIRLMFVEQPVLYQTKGDTLIKGHYKALLQREDGKTVSLTLCSDWVEDNFTPECLSIVQ